MRTESSAVVQPDQSLKGYDFLRSELENCKDRGSIERFHSTVKHGTRCILKEGLEGIGSRQRPAWYRFTIFRCNRRFARSRDYCFPWIHAAAFVG